MIDFKYLYSQIPFGLEIAPIHHVGFMIPSKLSYLDLHTFCDKSCTIDILKAEVGYKKVNNIIVEVIKPIDERSILYDRSSKLSEITFDHFGYSNSNLVLDDIKHLKISKFHTCLFECEVEFLLVDKIKIEIVYDSL